MKIGIIICNRYKSCAGGKCFKAVKNREGAFDIYDPAEELEVVGYTSCGGCPGGNIEYAAAEMIKNGAEVIHLATGMVVGYPPCRSVNYFKRFIEEKYKIKVVVGTHPIPQKYYDTHQNLETWRGDMWQELIKPTLTNEELRIQYN
ncbi:MAG TPA: CGGC domain-containing protein [Bacteroidales bacterium]|nr:CGGC domain-containing protein [Bacteroidales bacterium]